MQVLFYLIFRIFFVESFCFTGHLPNKNDLICESLCAIADVLIEIGDLRSAKNKLRKAFNLKSSNVVEQENIIRNLKTGTIYFIEVY